MKRRSFIAIAGQAIAVSAVGLPGCHPVSASAGTLADDYCEETVARMSSAVAKVRSYPFPGRSSPDWEKLMMRCGSRVPYIVQPERKKVLPGHSRHTGR